MTAFKTTFLIVLTLLSFTACEDKKSIEFKKAQLEEKKQALATLRTEIALLEKEIVAIDATFFENTNEILVASIPVTPQPFVHQIEVRGTVQSRKNVLLSAETMGRLERLYVTEGQLVTKGQLLAELDASVLKNSISEIETSLELANILYNRQENLWNQNIGTEVQFLQSKNNKEALEKRLATLKSQLQMYRIKAPFDGSIDDVAVLGGEMVQPGMPIIRIVNQNDMYIKTDISESFIGYFAADDKVEVLTDSPDKSFKTTINAVSKVINNQNRTFTVEVNLPADRKSNYQPNQVVVLKMTDYRNENAIAVPTRLIQTDEEGKFVYVISNNGSKSVANKARIETGYSYNSKTEIIRGLNNLDQVIDKGYRDVNEGAEVKLASL